jgi:hypothetical protein
MVHTWSSVAEGSPAARMAKIGGEVSGMKAAWTGLRSIPGDKKVGTKADNEVASFRRSVCGILGSVASRRMSEFVQTMARMPAAYAMAQEEGVEERRSGCDHSGWRVVASKRTQRDAQQAAMRAPLCDADEQRMQDGRTLEKLKEGCEHWRRLRELPATAMTVPSWCGRQQGGKERVGGARKPDRSMLQAGGRRGRGKHHGERRGGGCKISKKRK